MTSKNSDSNKQNQSDQYAIVETSGAQFWLEPNRYYDLDRIKADINEKVTLDKVLFAKDGSDIKLGKPYIKDATVELKVMAHRRGPKILVYKMRPKKKTRRKNGHRQELTRVMVESISTGKKVQKKEEKAKNATATSTAKKTTKASKAQKEVK
tara:strand:+ start:22623 stop:23081 length:459 start_codon:yes stop_codon:yes gene_type:complete